VHEYRANSASFLDFKTYLLLHSILPLRSPRKVSLHCLRVRVCRCVCVRLTSSGRIMQHLSLRVSVRCSSCRLLLGSCILIFVSPSHRQFIVLTLSLSSRFSSVLYSPILYLCSFSGLRYRHLSPLDLSRVLNLFEPYH
jgi:hypothetical protein